MVLHVEVGQIHVFPLEKRWRHARHIRDELLDCGQAIGEIEVPGTVMNLPGLEGSGICVVNPPPPVPKALFAGNPEGMVFGTY